MNSIELSFIHTKQEKVATQTELINSMIQKVAQSPVTEQKRINTGGTNEVYMIKTESGKGFVVRIALNLNHTRHEEEKWALDQCLSQGISVPKVKLLDKIKRNNEKYSVCIESRLPGETFSDKLGELSESQKNELLNQSGVILSKIHSIPVKGFGQFDENGKAQYSSAQELLNDPYLRKEKMFKIADSVSLDPAIIRRALEIKDRGISSVSHIKPMLIHNDFDPKNILVEKGKVTGVIDFEMAEGGDPVHDLAKWHFFQKNRLTVDEIIKGYTNKKIFSEDYNKRFNLWRLYEGLKNLVWVFQEKDEKGIEFAKREITNDVNYYNEHLS